jgi:hypothetical protein
MREHLMATRMRYLQTLLKSLRADISTKELATNPKLLRIVRSMEFQLKQMECIYVEGSKIKQAV